MNVPADIDDRKQIGTTSADAARIAELEPENHELRRSNEILKAAVFSRGNSTVTAQVIEFIDTQKQSFGVEAICTELQIDSSTYYAAKGDMSARVVRDEHSRWGFNACSWKTTESTAPGRRDGRIPRRSRPDYSAGKRCI